MKTTPANGFDHPGARTASAYPVPAKKKGWVLGDPGELTLVEKPVPVPSRAEVLLRVDAVAICATDLDVIKHGPPALIGGGLPFNKDFAIKVIVKCLSG